MPPARRPLPRLSWRVPVALAASALPFAATAQEGTPPGIGTAREPVELPDPASPRFEGEQGEGLPPPEIGSDGLPLPAEPSASPLAPAVDQIDFEALAIEYDADADTVTASGDVVLRSGGRSVRADRVVWNRGTGVIEGVGNVRFVDAEGNQLFTDRIELTEAFEAGSLDNLLLALDEGGRVAARSAARGEDGLVTLQTAAYSACAVTGPDGCDKRPSWRITAERVAYNPDARTLRFRGAYLELFGARLLPLPGLSIRTDGQAVSGFLIPDLRVSESNGVEISGSYYLRLAPDRDVTLGAGLFTEAPPLLSAQYRQLDDRGAFQATGYLTASRRISIFTGEETTRQSDIRGYVFANGRYQFDRNWSLTGSVRAASDRTFLRRYDISREDRLRSTADLERITPDSYLSIAAWATQTLRLGVPQGQVPLVLPVVDFRRRLDDPFDFGGRITLQANTLAVFRDQGQETQRAFASALWETSRITAMGQRVTLSALARGDLYHSDENALTPTALYRGDPGFEGRAVGLVAADAEWPLVGPAFGGVQVLTPRVQLVLTPPVRNLAIPNEDARAIDLEDTNLFALNRFPGYDRFEDGARVAYGVDWQLTRPGMEVFATIGQSYRLDSDRNIFPDGTGLSEQVSDIVGRTKVRFRDFLRVTHRYRLDKDSLDIRRNEIDLTVGTARTYAELGYLRLDRDITLVEDLEDREEARAAVRVAFARYWSVFGSGVFNLTNEDEVPRFTSDGFQPIRTRLGFAYQDDCLEIGATWRRDYVATGDAERGNTFEFYLSLRNLGLAR